LVYEELPSSNLAMLAARVRSSTVAATGTAQYLSVLARPPEFTHRDRAVLCAAVDAGLRIEAKCQADEYQQHVRVGEHGAELLQLLLLGRTQQAGVEAERAGYDLNQPSVGVAFGHEGYVDTPSDRLCERVSHVVANQQALIRMNDDCILCLVPAAACLADQWQRQETLRRWLAQLGTDGDGMCVGYSAAHTGVRAAHQALVEARQALSMSQRQGYQGGVSGYAAAWVRELLTSAHSHELLERIHEALLQPLITHDRSHRHDLVRTLGMFLSTGTRIQQTADLLGVHRNSVMYRLQRATELTGADLDDGDTRLLLQLVLRITDVAETNDVVVSNDRGPAFCSDEDAVELVWFRQANGLLKKSCFSSREDSGPAKGKGA
jgi:sugar diacid utilization regulator